MSALREPANDRDSVWPFQHLGASFQRVMESVEEARTDYAAMEAVEGGPVHMVDVPGTGGDA